MVAVHTASERRQVPCRQRGRREVTVTDTFSLSAHLYRRRWRHCISAPDARSYMRFFSFRP